MVEEKLYVNKLQRMTQSLGYVGNGRKFTSIETGSIKSISGGSSDLRIDGGSKSVVIQSSESVSDAIKLDATGASGGIEIKSLLGGISLTTTGQTTISGATFTGGAITSGSPPALTVAQSGTTFTIDPSGAVTNITLPPVEAGLNYKFVLIAASDDNDAFTFTATGAHMYGQILTGKFDGPHRTAINAATIVTIPNNPAVGKNFVGDSAEFIGISTSHWYVRVTVSYDDTDAWTAT